jgi:hypothetical protein
MAEGNSFVTVQSIVIKYLIDLNPTETPDIKK